MNNFHIQFDESKYTYYLQALEFVDTFIMVLKRNDHQISFLYVYHHATTFLW